jgi:hypothetical protein
MRNVEVGVQLRAAAALKAVVRPKRLFAVRRVDAVREGLKTVCAGKGDVSCGVPVLGEDHVVEVRSKCVEAGDDVRAAGNGKGCGVLGATGQKIALHVDEQKGVGGEERQVHAPLYGGRQAKRYARKVIPSQALLRVRRAPACPLLGALLLGLLLVGSPELGRAQSQPQLPDAPGALAAVQAEEPLGAVSGAVVDTTGAAVSQAKVVLTLGNESLTQIADDDGHFKFTQVPGGKYSLLAQYPGMTMTALSGVLEPGEHLELDAVKLVVSDVAHVDAMTQQQQAEVELRQEETQRLVGVIPNYYVVYNWDAAPLTTRQKYKLAFHNTTDPFNAGISAGIAGLQYYRNDFSGYGTGPGGYFKRFGANMGDLAVGSFVGGAVLPSLLRQDPRYFYMGKGSIMHRTLYALSTAVICRGDNGRWQPNYSSIGGDIAAGAIAELYYPKSNDSGGVKIVETGLLGAVLDGVGNVVQEFLYKHFTPHAANYPSTTRTASPPSTPASTTGGDAKKASNVSSTGSDVTKP